MIGFDLWDVYQQVGVSEARADAGYARARVQQTDNKLHAETMRLEAKIDGLALICQAMFELLSERSKVTESDIKAKVDEIDRRDGRKDGKITGHPTNCAACGRVTHTRQRVCMYCGTGVTGTSIFGQV